MKHDEFYGNHIFVRILVRYNSAEKRDKKRLHRRLVYRHARNYPNSVHQVKDKIIRLGLQ